MGINAYLKKDIEDNEDFGRTKLDKAYFLGTEIQMKEGRWFFILSSLLVEIGDEMKAFVEQISFHEYPMNFPRQVGKYTQGTATAWVDWYSYDKINSRELTIVGENLADVRKLFEDIKSGKIAPQEPWDLPQAVPEKINPLRMLLIKISIWWNKYIRKDTTKTY